MGMDTTPGLGQSIADMPVAEKPRNKRPPSFKDLTVLARSLRFLLGLAVILHVAAFATGVTVRGMFSRMVLGLDVPGEQLESADAWMRAISLVQVAAEVIAMPVLIWFIFRAYSNLRTFDTRLRFNRGWAIFGWITPIWGLFRPKQIVNDIWRVSDPTLPRTHSGEGRPVHTVIDLWWAAWLLTAITGRIAVSVSLSAQTTDDLVASTTWFMVSDGLLAIAGSLAFIVVGKIAIRQRARREVLDSDGEIVVPEPAPETSSAPDEVPAEWKVGATIALALALAVHLFPSPMNAYNFGRYLGALAVVVGVPYAVRYLRTTPQQRRYGTFLWSPLTMTVALLLGLLPFVDDYPARDPLATRVNGSTPLADPESLPDEAGLERVIEPLKRYEAFEFPEAQLPDIWEGTPFAGGDRTGWNLIAPTGRPGAVSVFSVPPAFVGDRFLAEMKLEMLLENNDDIVEKGVLAGSPVLRHHASSGPLPKGVIFMDEDGLLIYVYFNKAAEAERVARRLINANL